MFLPVTFPSDADVVAEEAARFRALSSAQRIEVLRGILNAGWLMTKNSPHPEFARRSADEHERSGQRATLEFVARHGR